MNRRTVVFGGLAVGLAGCGQFQVEYTQPLDPQVTRGWTLRNIQVQVPDSLTVSEQNSYAPTADIVWHGEALGDRRVQVANILREGIGKGAAGLRGSRGVNFVVQLRHFHAVTPAAVARAPGAVHNISFRIQVTDARTGSALTEPQTIDADLEAYVGSAAIVSEIQGRGQRYRIVEHLAVVTAGWLGIGADQRRSFGSIGR
ncbi:MAG: hypothetical protein LJE62_12765 [Silicimonas sp.]|nr:hypothetical protein [Silicimonas sp.]